MGHRIVHALRSTPYKHAALQDSIFRKHRLLRAATQTTIGDDSYQSIQHIVLDGS